MTDDLTPPNAADAEDEPAPLHPDPQIAVRLEFTPVPRKVKRPDGWTPALQREFIRRLAETGSPQAACTAMGKNVTGIEAVYKVPGANSFRAAWDLAVTVGRRAQGFDCGPPFAGPVPGIQRRPPRRAPPNPSPLAGEGRLAEGERGEGADATPHPDPTLFLALLRKFYLKLQSERRARLEGRIAEADLYLRQASFFEVAIDLTSPDAYQALADARRDGVHLIDIAETDMGRLLDDVRRQAWAALGEPPRPAPPAGHLLEDHGTFRTEPLESFGRFSHPARGADPDEWKELSMDEQQRRYEEQYRKAAEEQAAYEAEALANYERRRGEASAPLPSAGEGSSRSEPGEGAEQGKAKR